MKYTREELNRRQREVQDRWFDEWNETGIKPTWSYEEIREQMFVEWLQSLEVGDKAHVCCWSDIEPVTVIKKTATTITVRYDMATRSEKFDPHWEVGGFSAICTNCDEQSDWWNIVDDLDGATEVFRFRKSKNQYMSKSGERLYPEWMKYYDFNF